MSDIINETSGAPEFDEGNSLDGTSGYMRFGGEEDSPQPTEEPEKEIPQKEDEEEAEEPEEEEESEEEEEEEPEESKIPGEEKWSPELRAEYKEMQRDFSQKYKDVGSLRIKANLIDAIERNPEATLRDLAQRFGVNLTAEQSSDGEFKFENIEALKDESLPDYIQRVLQANLKGLGESLKPKAPPPQRQTQVPNNDQFVADSLRYLDGKYADWGMYEEKMIELITKHPSYMNDLDGLYDIAKAASGNPKVAAAKKNRGRKGGKTRTGSKSSKVVVTSSRGKVMSFNEAWDKAKRDARK